MAEPTEPQVDARSKDIKRIQLELVALKELVLKVESVATDQNLARQTDSALDLMGDGLEFAKRELEQGMMFLQSVDQEQ